MTPAKKTRLSRRAQQAQETDVESIPQPAPEIRVAEPAREPSTLVSETAARWRASLSDLAGGSPLWDVDSLGDAIVDLTAAHPGGTAQLFAGRKTRLSNLAREGSALTHARRRSRLVSARTEELAQRYGFAPTYVAIGVATWHDEEPADETEPSGAVADDGAASTPAPGATNAAAAAEATESARAPVMLRPVRIEASPADAEVELTLDPVVEINPVLVRALRARGIDIDPDAIAELANAAHGFTPVPALRRIEQLAQALPGFAIDSRVVLGSFVHPGQALAEDLDGAQLAEHEVVAALAGDEDAIAGLARELPALRPADPAPEAERGVGDLDAGQHRVIDAVAAGGHLLIDAPPGVDVPGTVAALAAHAASQGQRVLYVPGTKRAGEAFAASMRHAGIGDLVLDLATGSRWREEAPLRLVGGLDPDLPDGDDAGQVRRDLSVARRRLSGYVEALHEVRAPWDASAYDAMQELARLTAQRPGPRTQARLGDKALAMTAAQREQAREDLARAAGLGAFRLRACDTPWYGTVLQDAEHATRTLGHIKTLAESLPTLLEQVAATATQTGLDEARTLAQWSAQLDLLEGIRSSLDLFVPAIFERNASDLAVAFEPSGRRADGSELSWSQRRQLRKHVKDMTRPGVVLTDTRAELELVQARRESWRRQCAGGGWPHLPEGLTTALTTARTVIAEVEQIQGAIGPSIDNADLREVPLVELATLVQRLADDDANLRQMPERAGVLGALATQGLAPLVQDLVERRVPTELVGDEFDLAWWSGLLERLLRGEPALADLQASSLDDAAATVRSLDAAHTDSLAGPVLAATAGHIRAAIATDKQRAQGFYRAVHSGVRDLRELQRRFGDVAWAPRPVWIVPPMLVPQVLEPERSIDLLVLDAVQHLPTEQAVAAIWRSRQVVVVGDTRRGGTGLVAAASVLPSLELPGDRLDLDAEIARFLVAHGYDGVIRPVPAPPRPRDIRLDLVAGTGMPGAGGRPVESVRAEVDHVVDLVIDHALTRPDSSLAVIALNARHADRIREAVLSTASGASVAGFFDPGAREPFTVVDVESVAGLRRDSVVLSVGYGKTPHGRVLYQFGAVGREHGADLLVDVLDACRHRLTVTSCLDPDELDADRLTADGARTLADLLRFARESAADREVARIEDRRHGRRSDELIEDLASRLRRHGLVVRPHHGPAGGVTIPMAVGHPELPGELALAVLTDDPDYVAEPSLRRRDRHWVQRLRNRGWRTTMVFSTAVFMDPQGEADRIKAIIDEVRAEQVATSSGPAPALPRWQDDDENHAPFGEPADAPQ